MVRVLLLLLLLLLPLAAFADDDDALRVKLTQANLYLQTNQNGKAIRLLESLKNDYPDTQAVLEAEADAYLQSGYRGRSIRLINRLLALAPDSETAQSLRNRAMKTEPYAAISHNTRESGDYLTEQLTRLDAAIPYNNALALGMNVEHDRAEVDWLIHTNGQGGPYTGENTRAEFYGDYTEDNGNHSSLSLFMAESVAGIGVWHNWLDNCGATSVELNLQRPNWDFVEEVADRGRKDKAQISRTHLFTPRLSLTASAALNRYNLAHTSNTANSASLFAGLSYTLPPFKAIDLVKHHAALWLDYAIDAEHPFHVEKKTTIDGFVFTPLPLESREIHSLTITLSQELRQDFSYELFGGYSYDRLGDDGPLFGAYVTWWPLPGFAVEGTISRSIRKEYSNQTVRNIGIQGRWRF